MLLALVVCAALPAPAGAALTAQPNDPLTGFPFSYTDTVSGLVIGQCQDASGFCIETPRPDTAAPVSVPGNFTVDEEGFYFLADATLPGLDPGVARFGIESAFFTPGITQGQQVAFTRIRFKFLNGLKIGTTYRITHPYGADDITADPNKLGTSGQINVTEDVGCFTPPNCNFAAAPLGRLSSVLPWDPTVAPAAPKGYIGNYAALHKVIGSPLGTNFVMVQELTGGPGSAPVAGPPLSFTDMFNVEGKLAGPAPAPAPVPIADATSLTYPSRQVGTTSAAQTVTITNHGTAALTPTAATVGGTDAGDFQVAKDGCSGVTVAPAASCTVDVVFSPLASGDRAATLSIADNSATTPQVIALSGKGTPAQAPAPPAQIIREAAPAPVVIHDPAPAFNPGSLAVGRISVASRLRLRAARHAIAVTFTAPAQANVVRVRLLRGTRPVATKLVALTRPGRTTAHLRARNLRPGRYAIEVTPGISARALGQAALTRLQIVR